LVRNILQLTDRVYSAEPLPAQSRPGTCPGSRQGTVPAGKAVWRGICKSRYKVC
jgi:hypothetical protein